jgi:hypothetical protein
VLLCVKCHCSITATGINSLAVINNIYIYSFPLMLMHIVQHLTGFSVNWSMASMARSELVYGLWLAVNWSMIYGSQ